MKRVLGWSLILFLLSGCGQRALSYPMSTMTPAASATETAIPSPTPIPTVALPLPWAETPAPSSLAISPANVFGVRQLALFGDGRVKAVHYTHDGTRLLVGTTSGIYVFDATTGERTGEIEAGDASAGFLVSPDDARVAILSWVDGITLWSLVNGQKIVTLSYPDGFTLQDAEYASPGTIVATGYKDEPNLCGGARTPCVLFICAWSGDRPTPRVYRSEESARDPMGWQGRLASSPDGSTLAVGLHMFDVTSLEPRGVLESASFPPGSYPFIDAERFSPDGTQLILSAADAVYLISIADQSEIRIPLGAPGGAISLVDDRLAVVNGVHFPQTSVTIVDLAAATVERTIQLPEGATAVELSPDGNRLAFVGSPNGVRYALPHSVRIWDLQSDSELLSISVDPVMALAAGVSAPIGEQSELYIVTGDSDGTIRIRDAASGEITRQWSGGDGFAVLVLTLNPSQQLLASVDANDHLRLWDMASGETILNLPFRAFYSDFFFSPDGATLVTIQACRAAWISLSTGTVQTERQLTCHGDDSSSLAVVMLPDGRLIADDASATSTLRLVDAATGDVFLESDPGNPLVGDRLIMMAASPDGRYLALAGRAPEIQVWDIQRGKLVHTLKGHSWYWHGVSMALTITQLTFSPASDLLVSEGIDGTTRLWDVESGMALKVIDAGDLYLYNTTRFTPDGRLLITAVSGVIRLWGLPPWP